MKLYYCHIIVIIIIIIIIISSSISSSLVLTSYLRGATPQDTTGANEST